MCQTCDTVRQEIEAWASKQSHDRCWYYPDIFRRIAEAVGADVNHPQGLPPRREFEKGCAMYQEEEYLPR